MEDFPVRQAAFQHVQRGMAEQPSARADAGPRLPCGSVANAHATDVPELMSGRISGFEEQAPLNNNRGNNNRRRGRGNNRQGGGGGQQLNRIDSRARGNAPQLLEKYKKLAHDAHLNGDRVQEEYYLRSADHYFRVIADTRVRQEEQRQPRQDRWQEGGDANYREDGDDASEAGGEGEYGAYEQQASYAPREREARLSVERLEGVIALPLEIELQDFNNRSLVLDDQNCFVHSFLLHARRRSALG